MDMERRPQYDEMLSKFGAQGKVKPPSREGIAAVESFELGFLRDPMHALVAAQNDKDEMVRRRQAVKAAARAAEIPMHIVEGRRTQGAEETPELPPTQTPDPPAGNGAAYRLLTGGASMLGQGVSSGFGMLFGSGAQEATPSGAGQTGAASPAWDQASLMSAGASPPPEPEVEGGPGLVQHYVHDPMAGLEVHQEAVKAKGDEAELAGKFAERRERDKGGDFMEDQRTAFAHIAARRMLPNPEAADGGMTDMSAAGWGETRDKSREPSPQPTLQPSPQSTPRRTPPQTPVEVKSEQHTPPQAHTPVVRTRPRVGGFARRSSAASKKRKGDEYDESQGDWG